MDRPVFDAIDRKILSLLQVDSRITAQRLADKVGLSSAACQKRLKRLRECGVIDAEVAVISPEVLGLAVTVLAQVRVARDKTDVLDRFKTAMRDAEEVMQCYYVTGEHNFALIVTLPDMEAYGDFSRRHFIDNPDVTSFTTSVVMTKVKTGNRIFIDTRA